MRDYRLTPQEYMTLKGFCIKYLKSAEKGTLKCYKKRLENAYKKRGIKTEILESVEGYLDGLVSSDKFKVIKEFDKEVKKTLDSFGIAFYERCLLYTSPSPRDS